MRRARRMGWWLAVPVGVALGLALAVGLDRAAEPAAGQGGRSGITLSAEQLRINQRIGQAGVRRANRANSRIDKLRPAATGPAGPPGPAGPAGPGAARIAFSAAAGSPPQRILDLAGVTINAVCVAEAGSGAALDIVFGVAQASTLVGTVSRDSGPVPGTTVPENVELPLPAGPTPSEGDPAPDGGFVREVVSLLFVTPTRTLNVDAALIADGTADRCSFNGVAVSA